MRSKLFHAALFASLFFRGCLTQPAYAQSPDLVLNPGSSYVDAGRGIPWGTQFNRTYVLVPNSPNASLCIYVVNNNPTNAHAFTTTTFQAADSQVADFSNNQGRFSSVTLNAMPATVPALQMVSGFIQSTAAAKVAVKFSGSSALGGAPDTADVFLVQTTSGTCGAAAGALPVQGAVPVGSVVLSNPLTIGGQSSANGTPPNAAQFFTALGENANDLSATGMYGIAIGAGNLNVLNAFSGLTAANRGPLATMLFAQDVNNSTSNATFTTLSHPGGVPGTNGASQSNSSMNSLFVQNNGFATLTAPQTIISNGQQAIFGPGWKFGTFDNCFFTVTTGTPTGTTPTLDVYVQSSNDGTNYTDRIHFNQITLTAGTQKQSAALAGQVGGFNPQLMTTRALAVGTRIDGPIGGWLQFDFVIAGASASFPTVQFGTACH